MLVLASGRIIIIMIIIIIIIINGDDSCGGSSYTESFTAQFGWLGLVRYGAESVSGPYQMNQVNSCNGYSYDDGAINIGICLINATVIVIIWKCCLNDSMQNCVDRN